MSAPCMHRVRAPAVDRTVPLPIGTRVVRNPVEPCSCCDISANRRPRPPQFGTVMPYDEEYSRGSFSVRWDSGIWEAGLDVSYVTAVSPEQEAAIRAEPPRAPREASVLRRKASVLRRKAS